MSFRTGVQLALDLQADLIEMVHHKIRQQRRWLQDLDKRVTEIEAHWAGPNDVENDE